MTTRYNDERSDVLNLSVKNTVILNNYEKTGKRYFDYCSRLFTFSFNSIYNSTKQELTKLTIPLISNRICA